MSVIIDNKKLLDSNNFERLIIIKKNNDYVVKVHDEIDDGKKYVSLSNQLTELIKGLTDEEQVNEIIDYYLRNHTICGVSEHEPIPYYYGRFDVAKSKNLESGQTMSLQIPFVINDEAYMDRIISKYDMDRHSFLNNNSEVNNYQFNISYFSTSYEKEFNMDFEPVLNFGLNISEEGNDYDTNFFKSALEELLGGQMEKAYIEELFTCRPPACGIKTGAEIKCGELVIRLSNYKLYKIAKDIIEEHNKKIEKNKTLQLKLEGF